MNRYSPVIAITCVVILQLQVACSNQDGEPTPTAEQLYSRSESLGYRVAKIEIKQGGRIIREIRFDSERWEGEAFGPVQIRLPYETMDWVSDESEEALSAWDSLGAGGPPALVVQEYVVGGTAPLSHRWIMRIFLWDKGGLSELPPIVGSSSGEGHYFKDLNGDGSMEFVNTEALSYHDLSADGLPLSPRVYRFNGERYEPVTEKETWPDVRARVDEARATWRKSNQ